jgi:L-lactate dehydrogenase complex protein LldE
MTVTLFIPCFIDALYPRAGISMVQILERLGHKVVCPEEIACCGQPPFNSGYWARSAHRRRRRCWNISRTPRRSSSVSGSCGAMVKNFYPELFASTPQAELAKHRSRARLGIFRFPRHQTRRDRSRRKFPHKVTFHDGCHGLRELGIKKQPRALLAKVRDLQLVEMPRPRRAAVSAARFPRSSR